MGAAWDAVGLVIDTHCKIKINKTLTIAKILHTLCNTVRQMHAENAEVMRAIEQLRRHSAASYIQSVVRERSWNFVDIHMVQDEMAANSSNGSGSTDRTRRASANVRLSTPRTLRGSTPQYSS